jgi:hypothetical protein
MRFSRIFFQNVEHQINRIDHNGAVDNMLDGILIYLELMQ